MVLNKHFGEREEKKLLNIILVERFDARNEMDRAVRNLKMSMTQPMQSIFIRSPEEEARITKEQYDRTLTQINLAQQRYLERLEHAKKADAVGSEDYTRARMDVSSSFSPFGRMRTKAREAYESVVRYGRF